MEATATSPVAVASTSTASANNKTINAHYSMPNVVNVPIQSSIWVSNTAIGATNLPELQQNRPLNQAGESTPVQLNKPKTAEIIESSVIEHSFTMETKISGLRFPPRIHRNSGELVSQSPPNAQNMQYLQKSQNAPNLQFPQSLQHLNIQYPPNSQHKQNIQIPNVQNPPKVPFIQNAHNPHNMLNMQHLQQTVQYTQNTQTMIRAQHIHNLQNAQNSQNRQYPQNVPHPLLQNQQNVPHPQLQNQQNPQNRKNPQNKKKPNAEGKPKTQNPDDDEAMPESPLKRVLVSGYPTYAQAHDLLEVFTKFGSVRIDKCNSASATLTYASEEQARTAIEASKRLHIYGHFLSVKPFSGKLKSDDTPKSPKREFTMTKQKSVIIEPSKIDMSGTFHTQLDLILATVRLNQDEINKIGTLYRDLEVTFQAQWPGCKAIPFGSITTGLGIKTSDADCFMNLPIQFRSPQANHVNKARRLLLQHPLIFTEILAIPRANTPIVKFYHVPTDINCDLTFKTPLGARNSRLITFLLQADPRITPVAVIIKYWAKVHDLSGTGKLTNYALTLLIIFYLQQPPHSILPPIEWLQRDRANDIYVDYWNTGFMMNTKFLPPSSCRSTISELLGGFFQFYSIFDFEEMIVCPYLGIPIKKEAFKDTACVPPEFQLYKNNVLNGLVLPLRYQTSFCAQDPFEQCHNVASTITNKLALDIKTYFKFVADAYEKEKLNNCTGFLKTMLLEKPKLLRGKSHLEYRVPLFPRIVNMIVDPDWKSIVRNLVTTIFEKIMKIKLGKVEEKLNPDTKKEKEKYTGRVKKPIWKRQKYTAEINFPPEISLEEKETLISDELVKGETKSISLQIQVIMIFCHDPKSAVLTVRMGGGDLDAFRDFGKFYMSVMQLWVTELLRPFSIIVSKDTAAKIAEANKESEQKMMESDDDDDTEISPCPSPTDDSEVAEEIKTNSSDDAVTNNDSSQHETQKVTDARPSN